MTIDEERLSFVGRVLIRRGEAAWEEGKAGRQGTGVRYALLDLALSLCLGVSMKPMKPMKLMKPHSFLATFAKFEITQASYRPMFK